jgi:hypothetical protein
MRHDFGYMFFVMGAMGGLMDSELRTRFDIGPWHDPVEPLFIAVDPQDLRARR